MSTDKKNALKFLQQSKTEQTITGVAPIFKETKDEEKSDSKVNRRSMKKKETKEKMPFYVQLSPDLHKLLKLHSAITSVPMAHTVESAILKHLKSDKNFKEQITDFVKK